MLSAPKTFALCAAEFIGGSGMRGLVTMYLVGDNVKQPGVELHGCFRVGA